MASHLNAQYAACDSSSMHQSPKMDYLIQQDTTITCVNIRIRRWIGNGSILLSLLSITCASVRCPTYSYTTCTIIMSEYNKRNTCVTFDRHVNVNIFTTFGCDKPNAFNSAKKLDSLIFVVPP